MCLSVHVRDCVCTHSVDVQVCIWFLLEADRVLPTCIQSAVYGTQRNGALVMPPPAPRSIRCALGCRSPTSERGGGSWGVRGGRGCGSQDCGCPHLQFQAKAQATAHPASSEVKQTRWKGPLTLGQCSQADAVRVPASHPPSGGGWAQVALAACPALISPAAPPPPSGDPLLLPRAAGHCWKDSD